MAVSWLVFSNAHRETLIAICWNPPFSRSQLIATSQLPNSTSCWSPPSVILCRRPSVLRHPTTASLATATMSPRRSVPASKAKLRLCAKKTAHLSIMNVLIYFCCVASLQCSSLGGDGSVSLLLFGDRRLLGCNGISLRKTCMEWI